MHKKGHRENATHWTQVSEKMLLKRAHLRLTKQGLRENVIHGTHVRLLYNKQRKRKCVSWSSRKVNKTAPQVKCDSGTHVKLTKQRPVENVIMEFMWNM